MPRTKIAPPQAALVLHRSRMKVYTTLFGRYGMRFETQVFNMAGRMIKDKDGNPYDGGFWEYAMCDNGAFFMYPTYADDDMLRWEGTPKLNFSQSENYYRGHMTPEAAGITICILALNWLAAETQSQQLCDLWEKLMDYARTHAEWKAIRAAID